MFDVGDFFNTFEKFLDPFLIPSSKTLDNISTLHHCPKFSSANYSKYVLFYKMFKYNFKMS